MGRYRHRVRYGRHVRRRRTRADRAQGLAVELKATALKRLLEKAVIKAGVVGDDDPILQSLKQGRRDVLESRRVFHHRIADTSQAGNPGGNGNTGIDQGLPAIDNHTFINLNQSELGHSITTGAATSGLAVEQHHA